MDIRALARAGLVALLAAFAVPAAHAGDVTAVTDPAAKPVAMFSETLLDNMKNAKQLGFEGRFAKLKPVVEKAFDMPTMTRGTVGVSWATFSVADQQALIQAFERMTVASYANSFDGYSGEKFDIDPNVQLRGADKFVKATLVLPHDNPVAFVYRMRESNGSWKIIDILLDGYVSEVATRRSDFTSTISSGGAPALIKQVNALSDKLISGH